MANLRKFVRAISAVFFTIAFENHVDTVAIAAFELILRARVDKGAVDFITGIMAVWYIVASPFFPHTF